MSQPSQKKRRKVELRNVINLLKHVPLVLLKPPKINCEAKKIYKKAGPQSDVSPSGEGLIRDQSDKKANEVYIQWHTNLLWGT